MIFNGIQVIESEFATQRVNIKPHIKNDSMKESYHKRINKKWRKRFGTKDAPGMYYMGDKIVAHPKVIAELKRQTT